MNVAFCLLSLSVFYFHCSEKHGWKDYERGGFFCLILAIILNILCAAKII